MSEFSRIIITKKGQALMAKMIAGTGPVEFTEIRVSDTAYSIAQLENLTGISGVKQTTPVSKITRLANSAVQIEGAISNADLTTGYYIRTIGLYAKDPQDGEILYGVSTASTAGYFPPFNGKSTSAAYFKLVTDIGNADEVYLEVDPAGVATIGDVQELEAQIADLQAYIGYNDDSIVGVEVDMANRTVTRIAGAVNRSAGAMFDDIFAFGGRARVNLTNDGVEVATFGDGAYTETGKLTQAVTIDGTTYSIGTNVQTMVRQPKFYYKLVPLSLRPIEDGDGFHMDKFRLYISDEAKAGFKLHRAFKSGEKTNNKIYLSAFEASAYDVTTGTYNMIDSQDVAFAEDLLSSIANAKPISGATQQLTLAGARQLAQNRGAGWNQSNLLTASVTQMLFMVEYATLNSQTALGQGIYIADGDPDPTVPVALPTGATTALGNGSGNVESGHVTYRGEENLWSNIYAWVDGFMVGISGEHKARVAGMNANYVESNPDASPDYDKINFTMPKTNGWISAFGYDEEHDYVFIPTETTGNSVVPVGDHFYQNHTSSAWSAPLWGGYWAYGSYAGVFVWNAHNSPAYRYRNRGARLVYASDN